MPEFGFYPHLTATGPPPFYRDVAASYREHFLELVDAGTLRPMVLHYHLMGYAFLLTYLCFPHKNRPWLYNARWAVLGLITWWNYTTLWETSSGSHATNMVVGVISSYGWATACTWLFLSKPQWDAKRVQRRMVHLDPSDKGICINGHARDISLQTNGHVAAEKFSALKGRTQVAISKGGDGTDLMAKANGNGNGNISQVEEYFWESYPESFRDRFFWTSDLLINFRGPGWNWAVPGLPAPPESISKHLKGLDMKSARSGISFTGLQRFDTRQELFRYLYPRFVAGYFLIDFLKTIMMKDPYFIFGPTTYALPPFLQKLSPLGLWCCRAVLSGVTIIHALEMAFMLGPLLLCFILGPKVIGQRGEAWYYPTVWGSFSNVLDKGLNGLWGGYWHQTFRLSFAAPTKFLIGHGYIEKRSIVSKVLQLFFAFGISGIIHFAGSVTQLARTHHLHNPIFFMLQALGILIQSTACAILNPFIIKLPTSIRRTGNCLFVVVWLLATGSWLADDFARGGVWLWEPVPISPFRGLGFGLQGDGWWCWDVFGWGWHHGEHWWDSGFAM
ncbi:hypothetical protein HYALB_00004145 [Hymenoscyphus albidus]|uniref:Wax synthase domain-containing protein n=1 Tax=Hymenoscyphus albidus TaxID=595503 RepID=A0A9N9LFV0_9HELO|nr:hypothetical protein HYALB_00004145 [Hymenoscyphus albidus]